MTNLEFLLFIDTWSLAGSADVMHLLQEKKDYGGPTKEFFNDVLCEIEDKYFLNGVKHYLKNNYYNFR